MLFYDVELLTIPKIKYNCAVATEDYHAHISPNKRLLEF